VASAQRPSFNDGKGFCPPNRRTAILLNWFALLSKANAIRQSYAFGSYSHDKISCSVCSCESFPDAPGCSGLQVSRLSLRNARAPDVRGSLVSSSQRKMILRTRWESFSQCSMMWATISKATIPRVARDAANTKRVRRFSSVVIIARWKPTLASILSFRACQRV
jgi:hypothetical protein